VVVGELVIKNSDALFVLMQRLPARSAVWLLPVAHRRGHQRGEHQEGYNVPDAAFRPSHRALVQVQMALREEARMAEPSRVVICS